MAAPSRRPLLRDLTKVDTIYCKRLRTKRVQLRRRYVRSDDDDIELATITNAAEVHELANLIFPKLDEYQEHFVLFVCNMSCEVIGFKVLASGLQDAVLVDARMVFRNALLLGAHAIIAVHNHPSGRRTPSSADLDLTRHLAEAGRVLDIELLDHLIWTRLGYTAIRGEHPELFEPGDPA